MWGMWIKVTGWQIVTDSVVDFEMDKKDVF
jgi:hypothetical protein